jgi:metal-dependent HD superfamily phosphatase/phosphodiesterase
MKELPKNLRQIMIMVESARMFNERKNHCINMISQLSTNNLATRILIETLDSQEFVTFYKYSNMNTSTKHLWNRHDPFHLVSALLHGLKIADVLRKTGHLNEDKTLIPALIIAFLWHDALRAITETSEHAKQIGLLQSMVHEQLSKYGKQGLIDEEALSEIEVRSLLYIWEHNMEDKKCSDLGSAIVRIGDGLDCDKWRAYINSLYDWERLLRYDQLTHVLGTLLIKEVNVEYSGDDKRPVLINFKLNGYSKNWRKYNWYQIQERVKRKIESSGYGHFFRMKVAFKDGKSFLYDF